MTQEHRGSHDLFPQQSIRHPGTGFPGDTARERLCHVQGDGLPLPYRSKLMLQFVNANIVESSRGRQGGFRLSRNANDLYLMEIVEVIGGERRMKECLLGLKECSEETACAMHCQWYPVKQELHQLLEQQSVGSLAAAVDHGKYKLTELNLDSLLPPGARQTD
jgi:Rrf2 family protein